MIILSRSLIFYVMNNKPNLNIFKCDTAEQGKGIFQNFKARNISNAAHLQLLNVWKHCCSFTGSVVGLTFSKTPKV